VAASWGYTGRMAKHPLTRRARHWWLSLPGRGVAASRVADVAGKAPVTLAGAPTWRAGPNGFRSPAFNGSSQYGSVAVNLSAFSTLTLTFWLYWDAYANDFDQALEYTADGVANSGFYVMPNHNTGVFEVAVGPTGTVGTWRFARPAAAAWHHYVVALDRSISTGVSGVWIDGAAQSPGGGSATGTPGGTFANSTLYLMARAGSSLFGAGRLADVLLLPGYKATAADARHLCRQARLGYPDLLEREPVAAKAPAAAVTISLSPLAASASLASLAAAAGVTLTTTPLAAQAAPVAPSAATGVEAALAAMAATATPVAPAVEAQIAVSPDALAASATPVAPSLTVGTEVAPAALAAQAAPVAPVATTGTEVALPATAAQATPVSPAIAAGWEATLAALAASAAVVSPNVATGWETTLDPLEAVASVPDHTAAVTTGALLSPLASAVTAVAPSATTGQLVSPDALQATATAVSPLVAVNVAVNLSPMAVGGTLVAPNVSAGGAGFKAWWAKGSNVVLGRGVAG